MSGEGYMKAAYGYLYIRDFERAREAFERAISCEPTNPTYYFRASVTAHRSGLYQLARQWAEHAAAIDPENTFYQQHVNVVKADILLQDSEEALRAGDLERAEKLLRMAALFDPLNTSVAKALTEWPGNTENQMETSLEEDMNCQIQNRQSM